MKYEYQRHVVTASGSEVYLNQLGQDDWRVISVDWGGNGMMYFLLEREIEEKID